MHVIELTDIQRYVLVSASAGCASGVPEEVRDELVAAGLVESRYSTHRDAYVWALTDAGRCAAAAVLGQGQRA